MSSEIQPRITGTEMEWAAWELRRRETPEPEYRQLPEDLAPELLYNMDSRLYMSVGGKFILDTKGEVNVDGWSFLGTYSDKLRNLEDPYEHIV